MKQIVCTWALLIIGVLADAQEFNFDYSSSKIADSLKEGANSVIRLDEGYLDIVSPSRYVFRVHQVVTILNAAGAHHLRHRLYFDKFRTIDDITVKIYNAPGILVHKYSRKDFSVEAAYDGISLATDDKLIELTASAPGYPCTVEVQYVIKANSYIELPDWYIDRNNTSTEICRYTVRAPANLDIRHRCVNMESDPSIVTETNKKIYCWEIKNIRAKKIQADGFRAGSYYPAIQVAPNFFEYDGYAGEFSSWSSFGQWNFGLYQEPSPFSEARRSEIKSLVANVAGTRDKIDLLYDYLKKNMRYVSIQFGIGGFRPFPVKYVDEKKYGDCKALTNYMRCLLEVAGIKSYPALINAGSDLQPVDSLFPSSSFNHVILCVPGTPDSIWLECTSRDSETGFLGTFTENKNALLLTEKGGILTRTPASKAERNSLAARSEIFLTDEGGAKAQTMVFCTGDIADELRQVRKMNPDDQKEIFVNHFNFRSADEFSTSPHNDSMRGHRVQLDFRFDKLFAFKAGNKYFFPQKLNKLFEGNLKDETRDIDFLFKYPFVKTDTTLIHLPKGFVPDELPQPKEIDADFASYKKQVISIAPDQIKIVTFLLLKKHIIPAGEYKKLKNFFARVDESEEENLVLKKL